jgi:hypothetical protein
MLTTRRMMIALAAVVLIAGAMPAFAQEAATAQGQLVRVDTRSNTIEIKTAAGADMQFRYTDQTKVTGASEDVSGLATMAGADVTVHYTKQGQDNIASSITVHPKK